MNSGDKKDQFHQVHVKFWIAKRGTSAELLVLHVQANSSGHARARSECILWIQCNQTWVHANMIPTTGWSRVDAEHIGNTDWQAIIGSQTQLLNLKLTKWFCGLLIPWSHFQTREASKNIHELDPSIILSAPQAMAHCRVLIHCPWSQLNLCRQSMFNIGDLIHEEKTGLSARKKS